MKKTGLTVILIMAIGLAGCGSGGDGSGGGSDYNNDEGIEPTLSDIQQKIFTPTCAIDGCHGGSSPQLGLLLTGGNSYDSLVGVISQQDSQLRLRVEPGNPDNSYLVHKISGTAGQGGRMPLGGTPLSAAKVSAIRQWITLGALESE